MHRAARSQRRVGAQGARTLDAIENQNLVSVPNRNDDVLVDLARQRLHDRVSDLAQVEAGDDSGSELEKPQRRLVLAAFYVMPDVAERAQGLQQAMRIAARDAKLARKLADAARPIAARDGLEHFQAFDKRCFHAASAPPNGLANAAFLP